jgi:hypothetical protein
MEPLVAYLPRFHDEAAISYLDRLAYHNGFVSGLHLQDYVASSVKRRHRNKKGDAVEQRRRIARALNELERVAGWPKTPKVDMHLASTRTPSETRSARVCEQCWSEHPYYRVYWRFIGYKFCFEHGANLLPSNEPGYGNYPISSSTAESSSLGEVSPLVLEEAARLISSTSLNLYQASRRIRRQARLANAMTDVFANPVAFSLALPDMAHGPFTFREIPLWFTDGELRRFLTGYFPYILGGCWIAPKGGLKRWQSYLSKSVFDGPIYPMSRSTPELRNWSSDRRFPHPITQDLIALDELEELCCPIDNDQDTQKDQPWIC